jgi:hypothetical protein
MARELLSSGQKGFRLFGLEGIQLERCVNAKCMSIKSASVITAPSPIKFRPRPNAYFIQIAD